MDFARTDDDRLVQQNFRRLLRSRDGLPRPGGVSLWPTLAELGVLGALLPEDAGGMGGGPRTLAMLMAEVGQVLAIEPILGCAAVAARIIEQCLNPSARGVLLGRLLHGRWICVLAHDSGGNPFETPRLAASLQSDGAHLRGTVRCVRYVDLADEFLVTAHNIESPTETCIFLVPKSTPGLRIGRFRLMDGNVAGTLGLDCRVSSESILRFRDGSDHVLHDAIDWGILGLIAETAGIVAELNAVTFSYLLTRKQFGTSIGRFQALQHRAADMRIAEEELEGVSDWAIEALDEPPNHGRSAAIAAAKVRADVAGRLVGHEAMQMHGGMGVSEECAVSRFARRLGAIRAEFGSADVHRLRFAELNVGEDVLYKRREAAEVAAFRREARGFLATHLPPDLRQKTALGLKLEKAEQLRWHRILRAQGWLAGWWPKEHGGRGWSVAQRVAFAQELALGNAPPAQSQGVNMIGPVIYTFGTDLQKREYLPGIVSGDVWWCQGFSEPNSGSDLASLKTAAVREGGVYIVNGTKMWTSEAHLADMMYCLVRTSNEDKPQKGISLILIDLRAPGITVRPILTIDGLHRTNQLFLDNVRVPPGNLIGTEGQGWAIAKFLLKNERASLADIGTKIHLLSGLRSRLRIAVTGSDVDPTIQKLWKIRIADLEIQLLGVHRLEQRLIEHVSSGQGTALIPFMMKIRATEILQAISELEAEMQGPFTSAYDPGDPQRPAEHSFTEAQLASLATYRYLYSRCWSIFGGSNEIQRNVIAKHVLEL